MDKQNNLRPARKPVTPALSSRFRSNTKAPLVPRLAASAVGASPVVARKDVTIQPISPIDDLAAALLSGNVTPRSGMRSSRIGTESPATPARARRPSLNATVVPGSAANSPATSNRLAAASAPNLPRRDSGGSTLSRREDDTPKFFRAGDVRPTSTPPTSQSQGVLRPGIGGFVRTVDGLVPSQHRSATTAFVGGSSLGDEKFLHASDAKGTAQVRTARPILVQQTSTFRTHSPDTMRYTSPISPQMSPVKGFAGVRSRPGSPIKHCIIPATLPTPLEKPTERRSSIDSSSVVSKQSSVSGHKKAMSVSTISYSRAIGEQSYTALPLPDQNSAPPFPVETLPTLGRTYATPETLSPRSASLTSAKTIGTSTTAETEVSDVVRTIVGTAESRSEALHDTALSVPQPQLQTPAQVNAANARRERKVLDLEISNSSLLAINKTLERELRKQSTELRRYRRLSRSGRISLAPSHRSASNQSALSILSEHTSEEGSDISPSEYDDSSPSSPSDGGASFLSGEDADDNEAGDAKRARRRRRDERRLMLDLTKHQQQLIDSQKLSQSIRKCLDLTEELIRDGRKALDYRVGIGDVKLGGRILQHEPQYDDYADDHADHLQHASHGEQTNLPTFQINPEPRRGLLSPGLSAAELSGWLNTEAPPDELRSNHEVDGPGPELIEPG